MIKTGVEIWKSIQDINKKPATTIDELVEKCFDKKILEKWVNYDELLSDLKSWLQSNDFDELKQCVEDTINELEEDSKLKYGGFKL